MHFVGTVSNGPVRAGKCHLCDKDKMIRHVSLPSHYATESDLFSDISLIIHVLMDGCFQTADTYCLQAFVLFVLGNHFGLLT